MAQDDPVRIIRHEAIPDTGSYEVVFPGGNRYFYFEDNPGRRLRPETLTRAQALEQARTFARQERDKIEQTCPACDGTGWVCEDHPDQPWDGPQACTCGAAGAPCPHCNRADDGEPPRLPRGFERDDG